MSYAQRLVVFDIIPNQRVVPCVLAAAISAPAESTLRRGLKARGMLKSPRNLHAEFRERSLLVERLLKQTGLFELFQRNVRARLGCVREFRDLGDAKGPFAEEQRKKISFSR